MTFGDAWRKAGEVEVNFEPPVGRYHVQIVDAGAFEGRDGREWCKVTLQVIGTEHAGRQFDHFGPAGDHNPVGLRIMREALITYGLDPEGIDELDDLGRAMFELIGTEADISVSIKDGFRNIKVLGSTTGKSDIPTDTDGPSSPVNPSQESFASAASRNDDDIPF